MKIFFLAAGNDGCGFYRAYLPSKFLNGLFTKTQINIEWFSLPPGCPVPPGAEKEFKRKLEFADKADIIVMQRPEHPALLKQLSENRWRKKFVYENDDLMWGLDPDNPMSLIPRNKEIIELLIQGAHHVTTTTDFLKQHYLSYNKNVTVLPNSLDLELYEKDPPKNDTGRLRILITGSVAHLENMKGFQKVLEAIIKKYPDVVFVVHGLAPKAALDAQRKNFPQAVDKLKKQYAVWDSLPKRNIEHALFSPTLFYPASLASLKADLAVIPRKENDFNKAKSNVKFLELAAAKIPVIAQTFAEKDSPYDKDINGQNGILADTLDSWLGAIETVLANRQAFVNNAYQYVREHYDIRNNIRLWKECYERLLAR